MKKVRLSIIHTLERRIVRWTFAVRHLADVELDCYVHPSMVKFNGAQNRANKSKKPDNDIAFRNRFLTCTKLEKCLFYSFIHSLFQALLDTTCSSYFIETKGYANNYLLKLIR